MSQNAGSPASAQRDISGITGRERTAEIIIRDLDHRPLPDRVDRDFDVAGPDPLWCSGLAAYADVVEGV